MLNSEVVHEIHLGDSFELKHFAGSFPPKYWVWGTRWSSEGGCKLILAAYSDPADKVIVPVEDLLARFSPADKNDHPKATVAWRADWVSAGGYVK